MVLWESIFGRMMVRGMIIALAVFFPLAFYSVSSAAYPISLIPQNDPNSLRLMGVSLEGPVDSVSKRLKTAEWASWGQSDDNEDYYFRGTFYGIRAKLMVTVHPETHLVNSAYVTIGPYSTEKMLERNLEYFRHKLSQEHGELTQYADAWVVIGDEGSIKLSVATNANGSRDIRVLYLVESAYYKDARVMGLRGLVQEVTTENPVSEDQFLRFAQDGKLENSDLQERQYDSFGYLRQARMTEKEGYSLITYEYDNRYRLVRRKQENPVAGVSYIHEYTYNGDDEVQSESQKVWEKDECVLTINLYNNFLTRDSQGNWTTNSLQLSYWEKGSQSQRTSVLQKRTITYWE